MEITIKNTIKDMIRNNFKGVTFNEWNLTRTIKNDEFIVYDYNFKVTGVNYKIKVSHDLSAKEINFKLWSLFNKIAEHNIQYL